MMLEEVMHKVKEAGGKRTRIREAILARLVSRPEPVSAGDLAAGLRSAKIRADRTTVYRELAALKKMGVIREVSFMSKASLFEVEGEHHHHLVCLDCGSLKPVKLPAALCRQERSLGKKEKFQITDHSMEFYGLCAKCQ